MPIRGTASKARRVSSLTALRAVGSDEEDTDEEESGADGIGARHCFLKALADSSWSPSEMDIFWSKLRPREEEEEEEEEMVEGSGLSIGIGVSKRRFTP